MTAAMTHKQKIETIKAIIDDVITVLNLRLRNVPERDVFALGISAIFSLARRFAMIAVQYSDSSVNRLEAQKAIQEILHKIEREVLREELQVLH